MMNSSKKIYKKLPDFLFYALLILFIVTIIPRWQSSYKQQGNKLTKFEAFRLDKTLISLPYENKSQLYFYWATWCSPCKAQFEILNALVSNDSTLAKRITAVNLGEDIETVKEFVNANKFEFDFVISKSNDWKELNVLATPTLILANEKGEIVYHTTGISPLIVQRLKSLLN